jgi:ferredoxin-NADP reductase
MGFFVLELAHPGDVVFAATGSGIAAALPMIAETLARPSETGRVFLYWGMRDQAELYWLDRLEKLAHPRLEIHICLSRPEADLPPGGPLQRGRITTPVLEKVPSLAKPIVYLVGNGDMVKELRDGLLASGMDRRRQIRTEVFYPATGSGG